MLDKIEVSEKDDAVFQFDDFEFVIHESGSYILSDSGYFIINGLDSFKKMDDDFYIILDEEDDKMLIKQEDFEKIKEIYLTF